MKLLLTSFTVVLLLTAFVPKKKNKLKLPEEFVLVPSGTIGVSEPEGDVITAQPGKRVSFNSFYISRFEITNKQFKDFYNEVSGNLRAEDRAVIACDTTGWRQILSMSEPMAQHYYQHLAYSNYPVVNISYEAAAKYCEWLQKKIQAENPAYTIEVKLPEKNQWIYAAMGGRSNAMYPWGNYYLRNRKGEFLCNYRKIGDPAIIRNRQTGKPEVLESVVAAAGGLNDRAFYTSEVKSFYPNDWGLYNVCGNVAEMVIEKGTAMGGSWNDYGGDVHIKSETDYNKASPTIGFRPVIIFKEKKNE